MTSIANFGNLDDFNFSLDTKPSDAVSRAGAGAHGIETVSGQRGVLVPCMLPPGPIGAESLAGAEAAAMSGEAAAGAPMRFVPLPDDLAVTSEGFRAVLAGAYQVFISEETGLPPSSNKVAVAIDASPTMVRRVMDSKAYRVAAKLRGIAVAVKEGLTPEQDLLLQVLSDPTIRGGLSERLKKAGVSYAKYRAWTKQPLFGNRLRELSDGILKETEGAMMVTLAEQGVNGKLEAIKYSFEVTGKHNPAAQAQTDVKTVVAKIIEILQQEIKDPEVLNRIGLRMQGAVLETDAQKQIGE